MLELNFPIDTNKIKNIINDKNVNIAGVSIGFSNAGKIVTKEIGKTDKQTNIDIKPNTIFGAASLSKPIFAYLVLKLIALNKVDRTDHDVQFRLPEGVTHFDLDTPLYKILPNERFTEVKFANKLTARMVLSHTTGLPIVDKDFGKKIQRPIKFEFEPGTQYGYSGVAMMYLQQVIQKLLPDLSLNELATKFVFAPLKMYHSSYYKKYDLDLTSKNERLPQTIYLHDIKNGFAYEVIGLDGAPKKDMIMSDALPDDFPKSADDIIKDKNKWLAAILSQTCRANHTTAPENAVNSLFTTPTDYMHFVNAVMNDKTLEDTFKFSIDMTTDAWAKGVGLQDDELKKTGWGLIFGLQKDEDNEVTYAYHSGDMNEWRAWVVMNFKEKTAIVFFANGANGHVLANDIITASPNIKLAPAAKYFSEKYGFAIQFEPNWAEAQKNRFNKIGKYLDERERKLESSTVTIAKTLNINPSPQSELTAQPTGNEAKKEIITADIVKVSSSQTFNPGNEGIKKPGKS